MSTQIEISSEVVKYLSSNGYRPDSIIDELVKKTKVLGDVAQMQIAPEQGQFLEIIVKLLKVKKCLEIGRFTGLSTLCMAKGLPYDGKIISIDNSDEFLPLAKKYWEKARVENKIESVIGQGVDVLQLQKELEEHNRDLGLSVDIQRGDIVAPTWDSVYLA